jgi:hypothetical protein
MLGPGYTHWYGIYDVAKNFYTEFIPELEELAKENLHADDPAKVKQAKRLQKWIDRVLTSEDHKWFMHKTDPDETEKR